jgi:hypothetical protein
VSYRQSPKYLSKRREERLGGKSKRRGEKQQELVLFNKD